MSDQDQLYPVYRPGGKTAESDGDGISGISRSVDSRAGVLDAAGELTISFDSPQTLSRLIERIGVGVSTGTVDVTVYVGSADLGNIVDYVSAISKANGDQYSPIYVPASGRLLVVFTNGAVGASVGARIQFREQ